MRVEDHPEYVEEQENLRHTYQYIHGLIQGFPHEFPGADNRGAQAVRTLSLKRLEEYKQAELQPYFGRVDSRQDDSSEIETIYIGRHSISHQDGRILIISWATPVAEALYYRASSSDRYGRLLLKRTFELARGTLKTIRDEFIDPSQQSRLGPLIDRFTDQLLVALLAQGRTGQLQNIVATIQAAQYELIRAPEDQVLIIQGVSGSGKTEIALHRVAYLLYQHRGDDRLRPQDVLILGPSHLFMNYVSGVLPSLGERQIEQATFDEWLLDQIGVSVRFDPPETSLEYLLNAGESRLERAAHFRRAQLKGSLKMAELIDRYTESLHREATDGREALTVTYVPRTGRLSGSGPTVTITRSAEEMQKAVDRHRSLPLNQRKGAAQDALKREIAQEILRRPEARNTDRPIKREDLERVVLGRIEEYFSDWRAENVAIAYRRLLRTPSLLRTLGNGLFSPAELELLTQDAPSALEPFHFSDLGALAYLKLRLDGISTRTYAHIVLDEAQDITPLQFKVVCQCSRNGSITMLGDLAQRIYPHHGIEKWDELRAASCDHLTTVETLSQSYRSTAEIVEYANSLLRRVGVQECDLPQSIARPGTPVELHPCSDRRQWLALMSELIVSEIATGHQSVAVVCKSIDSCRQLAAELSLPEPQRVGLINSRDSRYNGGVVIVPAYLTKGLEFDVVILADADADTYAADWLDLRLLYVALTRAAHALHVCWTGLITPLLDPELSSLTVQQPFSDVPADSQLTIQEFASTRPEFDADRCVEMLASAGKLYLLENGKIDEATLGLFLARHAKSQGPADQDEARTAPPLSEEVRAAIRRTCAQPDLAGTKGDAAFVAPQVVFGLMRHHLGNLDIPAIDDPEDPAAQVEGLARAYAAVYRLEISLGAGLWTTERRVLEAVPIRSGERARQILALLIGYGIVERTGNGKQTRIRIAPDRVQGLLRFALGAEPDDWDADLLKQIGSAPLRFDAVL